MSAPESPTENSQWSLIPLTPEYIPAEHGGYVAALEVTLEDKQIRNIALSGNYGVGKSSILRELGKRLGSRVVELSLSTLAPIETSKLNESVPIQATTPTNRIQQEIVWRGLGFWAVCFERVVLGSPGRVWPGGMDGREGKLATHTPE